MILNLISVKNVLNAIEKLARTKMLLSRPKSEKKKQFYIYYHFLILISMQFILFYLCTDVAAMTQIKKSSAFVEV